MGRPGNEIPVPKLLASVSREPLERTKERDKKAAAELDRLIDELARKQEEEFERKRLAGAGRVPGLPEGAPK
jgi:hypothetical protein